MSKERPILFSGPMVRALLDGSKTQTRRIAKVRKELPPAWATFASEGHSPMNDGTARPTGSFYWSEEQTLGEPLKTLRRWPILPAKHPMAGDWYWTPSPYGKPGDRLWVRETWMDLTGTGIERSTGDHSRYAYGADTPPGSYGDQCRKDYGLKWRPSIHMPRPASRITLEVTGVRVERLQDISDRDCIAEGIGLNPSAEDIPMTAPEGETMPRAAYRALWDSLAARGADWQANPWVWVVEFKRI